MASFQREAKLLNHRNFLLPLREMWNIRQSRQNTFLPYSVSFMVCPSLNSLSQFAFTSVNLPNMHNIYT